MSSQLMPSATSETIIPTVILRPRMQARPPILPGSKVIRSRPGGHAVIALFFASPCLLHCSGLIIAGGLLIFPDVAGRGAADARQQAGPAGGGRGGKGGT